MLLIVAYDRIPTTPAANNISPTSVSGIGDAPSLEDDNDQGHLFQNFILLHARLMFSHC